MYSSNQNQLLFPYNKGIVFKDFQQINKRKAKKERVQQVVGAKVVYANYPLLMHDFPQLSEASLSKKLPYLNNLSVIDRKAKIQELINQWVLKHSAYISTAQTAHKKVNTPIRTGPLQTQAYRPTNYGRALVFSIEETNKNLGIDAGLGESLSDKGLIDVKGVGVAPNVIPKIAVHGNGLINLSECFEALMMEQIIHRIFKQEYVRHETLPFYAIVDLGFEGIYPTRKWTEDELEKETYQPVGLLLRRAHNRQVGFGDLPIYGSLKHKATIDIELLLRKYGITSVNSGTTITINSDVNGLIIHYGSKEKKIKDKEFKQYLSKVCKDKTKPLFFEGVNIQITEDLETNPLKAILVDFGQYEIRSSFQHPILFLAAYRPLFWGGAMWPEDARYVQPTADLAINFALWKNEGGLLDFPFVENQKSIFVLSQKLAQVFRNGQITNAQIAQYIHQYLEAAMLSRNSNNRLHTE